MQNELLRRTTLLDHLFLTSDYRQVPDRNFLQFFPFFNHCCFRCRYLHSLRHRNRLVNQIVMLQWIITLFCNMVFMMMRQCFSHTKKSQRFTSLQNTRQFWFYLIGFTTGCPPLDSVFGYGLRKFHQLLCHLQHKIIRNLLHCTLQISVLVLDLGYFEVTPVLIDAMSLSQDSWANASALARLWRHWKQGEQIGQVDIVGSLNLLHQFGLVLPKP